MLSNLIGNAWKFTSKQEHAEIGFGQDEKNAEKFYFVRDNGAGFDMTYVAKLFGTFQRLHTAGEFEGTGIGLATVQRVVHRHGGRVWAEGAVSQGATFYFTLANFKETGNGQQSDLAG
jgi:light-regulated signal transduction histidine kinase (bacteriophytochrome)